jgi:amino acid adenylation domain-containing protein
MVAQQAANCPRSIAIANGSEQITYAELERRANQLAHLLKSVGVERESLVAVYVKRSPAFVIAALAAMKAGAAYLPLDPESPADRVGATLQDSATFAVITAGNLTSRLPEGGWRVVNLDAQAAEIAQRPTHALESEARPEDLAYVIYTSGSTGQPKGVEVPHSALANLVSWHNRAFQVSANDRAGFLAALGFDAAVWELWPYLCAGASVHVPEDGVRNDAGLLRDWLLREKITVSFVVTPLAEALMSMEWPSPAALRVLLTGADVLHRRPAADLPFALVNNYGPTEYTVVATSGTVAATGSALPSIGKAIDNTTVYVLDEAMAPVRKGEAGELYLGGAGLARGYRNLPDETAQRFVANPFKVNERLYRTGDLVRELSGGEVEFLGRADEQVKIRGFRIEPNEIASAIDSCAGIRNSAVITREQDGEKRLVAYVVLSPESTVAAPSLREELLRRLPDYMVPSTFVVIDAIPLTANGKVDRRALPEPNATNTLREEEYIAPRTLVEERLAELIAPLLRVERVGVNDNFFLLGGHSLLGTQLINRIGSTFGVNLPLLSLFDNPTLAGMASEVERLILAKIESGEAKDLQPETESAVEGD